MGLVFSSRMREEEDTETRELTMCKKSSPEQRSDRLTISPNTIRHQHKLWSTEFLADVACKCSERDVVTMSK
jgi:hypothetical protein